MTKYQDLPDSDLVEQYKLDVDPEIVGELFKRYKHIVLGIALRYLNDRSKAEDTMMEVFEELIKSLKKADVRYFKAWIGTVTRNYLHRKYRTTTRTTFQSLDDITINNSNSFMESSQDETLIIEKREVEEKESALLSAIEDLKTEQAECVKLFFLEQCSYTEVCQRTGFSFKNVKSFIQNGKRNLKNKLEAK